MELLSLHSDMSSLPYREVDRALMERSAFQHDFTTVRDETKWTQTRAGLSVNLAHEDHGYTLSSEGHKTAHGVA